MKFKMNDVEYKILEVEQQELKHVEEIGYYYGRSSFYVQKIFLDETLSYERMKKTLYHELMHIYIREYITTDDITFDEEFLCNIVANSHDIIHNITERYFKERSEKNGRRNEIQD